MFNSIQSIHASSHQKQQCRYSSVDVQVDLIQSRIISSESSIKLFQCRCSTQSNPFTHHHIRSSNQVIQPFTHHNQQKQHLSVDVQVDSIHSRIITSQSAEATSQCRCSSRSNPFTHHLISNVISM